MTASSDGQLDEWMAATLRRLGGSDRQWAGRFLDLSTGSTGSVRPEAVMDTMSVVKVPILLCLLESADGGEVDLTSRVRVTRDRKRLGTGVLQTLDDGAVVTLSDAARLMISVSDNTATDIVLEAIGGPKVVNEMLAARGYGAIELSGTAFDWFLALATSMDPLCAGYSPEELFVKGYPVKSGSALLTARRNFHFNDGTTFAVGTPRAYCDLFAQLARGEYLSAEFSQRCMGYLNHQLSSSRIPRYLPSGSVITHKAGDFGPFITNDAGVVTRGDGKSFVLCLFSRGNVRPWGYAEEIIARMALACDELVGNL